MNLFIGSFDSRKSQILTCKRNNVYIQKGLLILRLIQLVWRCMRPRYNWLPSHHFKTFNRWCCRFHMSLQNGDHSSPTDFCSLLSLCSASHISLRSTCTTISLSYFILSLFFLSLLLFLLQNIQRHTEKRKVDFSIRLLAVKLNQKENYFDRRGIKGDMIQSEPGF